MDAISSNWNTGYTLTRSPLRTGLSQRTVYRMVTEGRLKQAQRRVPGRRPLSVFDPGAVSAIVASTVKPDAIRQHTAPPQASASSNEGPPAETVSGPLLPPSEL